VATAETSQVWLDFGAEVGQSWVVVDPSSGSRWTVWLESTTDTVAVPAGTFSPCFRFAFRFWGADNDWVEWYAPGIGPVKRILFGFARLESSLQSAGVCGVDYPAQVEPELEDTRPERFRLYANYPNPFNAETWILYDLSARDFVRLEIYSLGGRKVRTLVSGWQQSGRHRVAWDGSDDSGAAVPSGVYLCRLACGRCAASRKLVLTR
jgi:hypothetical protein